MSVASNTCDEAKSTSMPRAVADDLQKHFSRLLHRVGRLDRLHGLHPRHLPLLHVGLPHHGRGLKLCYSRVLRSNPGSKSYLDSHLACVT